MASVVAAGMGAFAFATAPAAAATPVGVTVTCASGSSQIGCSVAWRDADGRVQIRWAVNGRHLASADNQTSFRLACVPGDGYAVTVVVADSTGRASDSARILCQRA
jgi:membrane carboxypeptidase/penicillin-binding protein PbpC